MAINTLNSYDRLTDSLERELLKAAQNGTNAYSALDGLAIVANCISRGAAAFGRYLVQVSEAMNEARAINSRFAGNQW